MHINTALGRPRSLRSLGLMLARSSLRSSRLSMSGLASASRNAYMHMRARAWDSEDAIPSVRTRAMRRGEIEGGGVGREGKKEINK